MNILVLGASGFIGAWVTTALLKAGYNVTCCVRDPAYARKLFPGAKIISCDFINDTKVSLWRNRLNEIDIVINCVGIFYHPNKKIIWNIHFKTPQAIFDAAFETNVKKIIHISALNVEKYQVEYAKSKKAAEDYLKFVDVPHVILKPSFVYGPRAYGGMALLRGLASFPFVIPVPGKGNQKLQPIHVADLTKAIIHFVSTESNNSLVLAAVSPTPISLTRILIVLRSWLAFTKAKILHIPLSLIKMGSFIGNAIPYSTINGDALKMLLQNNIASEEETKQFQKIIKFVPRDFETGVYSHPSEMQDRVQANLFIFKPMLRLSLAFIWLMSAFTSAFLFPKEISFQLLSQTGINSTWQPFFLYGASLLNFLIGIFLLINYKPKLNYILQLVVILFYTLIITVKLPYLWLEPFGPVAKNIPIMMLILFLFFLERSK